MDARLEMFLFLFALVGYCALMYWLASVAEKDMLRRGRRGWAVGNAFVWVSPWWPVWLLGWWAVRRRYPILEVAETKKSARPSS